VSSLIACLALVCNRGPKLQLFQHTKTPAPGPRQCDAQAVCQHTKTPAPGPRQCDAQAVCQHTKTPADRKRLAGGYNEPRMASGPGAYDCPPDLRPSAGFIMNTDCPPDLRSLAGDILKLPARGRYQRAGFII